ncbi:right-handed parallel beta-helix repeat-containing protein [Paenibacillus radicis (ex Xue et al. 2023)]|uniref:Right-handed parallel beta-helix repeat-containing protein n=1 Tax=Paenibacillus radicis (ex Xue et al. 2023) TaxID=2972489 RepID=A0ABT1YFU1_9BACL|nr:right-handed parallel beta-helix repeat-containing protein [Paenibacillus radicis (ex Xue et al. 2023)]MCR8632059.1 right-handed parallel beta-helix repeat-containing protein [Paenibacillus radicis (ex Xue et al. 2023)]
MAIIDVYPNSSTAIQDAVTLSNPGDVIRVHPGVYREDVQIASEKSNIRIISKIRQGAILDGSHTLLEAFALNDVAGVEIEGFIIKNYISGGIRIFSGKSNRILHNKISKIEGTSQPVGIFVTNSVGNFFMKNTIERIGKAGTGTGMSLNVVTGNWVIQNKLQYNAAHGIEVLDSIHDAIVDNKISKNKGVGIQIRGSENHLILNNKLYSNGSNAVDAQSTNNYIVNSKIKGNRENGLLLSFNYNFAGLNEIKDNHQSGIQIDSDYNDIQGNEIKKNINNGVIIRASHTGSMVFGNEIKKNKSHNIKDLGVNNNIFQNRIN